MFVVIRLDYEGLGDELRKARLTAGLTQQQLADLLGMDVGNINKIENEGNRSVGIETLHKMVQLLQTTFCQQACVRLTLNFSICTEPDNN